MKRCALVIVASLLVALALFALGIRSDPGVCDPKSAMPWLVCGTP